MPAPYSTLIPRANFLFILRVLCTNYTTSTVVVHRAHWHSQYTANTGGAAEATKHATELRTQNEQDEQQEQLDEQANKLQYNTAVLYTTCKHPST